MPLDLSWTEDILRSATAAGETLAKAEGWAGILPEVLAALGEATGVSRAHIFRNVTLPDGRLAMDMHAEWVAPGIEPVMGEASNHDWPYDEGCTRLEGLLSSGQVISGPLSGFLPEERAEIEGESLVSVAYAPLFVGGRWWGFLDFGDCVVERRWSALDQEVLRVIAGILSSAFLRDELAAERRTVDTVMRLHVESIPAITYMESADPDHPLGYNEYYISPQVETMLGYTPHEWLTLEPEPYMETIHPDDRARLEAITERTNETHEDYSIEYRIQRKDGEWIWLNDECHFVQTEDGSAPFWHGMMTDITERKRAEEQRDFQSRLLESISDAVIAYDTDLIVTSWNRAAEVLYGWVAAEVLGSPMPESIRYRPERLAAIWDPFVEDLRGWRGTTVQQDKDGYDISIETKGLPLLDAEGTVKGYVMVNREVAET